jgi:hypothetical protein
VTSMARNPGRRSRSPNQLDPAHSRHCHVNYKKVHLVSSCNRVERSRPVFGCHRTISEAVEAGYGDFPHVCIVVDNQNRCAGST